MQRQDASEIETTGCTQSKTYTSAGGEGGGAGDKSEGKEELHGCYWVEVDFDDLLQRK